MLYAAAYLATLVVFFLADMVWLGTMVSRLYRPAMGDILLPEVNLSPAITFYLLYPIGLVIFAVVPALRNESVFTALALGVLFGFFSYATYDLTNQATLRHWSAILTVADIAWGSTLGGISAASALWAVTKLFQQ